MTGGGDPVFSKIEHEYSLKMAVDHLLHTFPRSAGHHHIDKLISQLELECENIWKDGHQRCEKRSLTGQFCAYKLNHELLKDNDDDDNLKIVRDRSGSTGRKHQKFQTKSDNFKSQHCSGVKIFSMCNCGMSRRIRNDPFTLKEANFTFYNETGDDFNFGSCCANLDKYKFKLFDVSTAQLESKNVDKLEEFVENVKLNESIKQKSYSDVISMQGFYKIFFCWILSTFFIVGGFPVLKTGEYFSLIRKVRETRPLQMSKTLKPYNFSKWGQEQKKLETTIGNVKKTISNPQSESKDNEEVDTTNEIGGGLAIDPSDFNVRFFDEGDDEESGEEIGEKINKIKLSQTQEDEKEKLKLNPSQILLLGENEYDEDEDEPIRKKNVIISDEEVSEDEEEDYDDEEEEEREMNAEIEEQEQTSFHSNVHSSTMGILNDNEDVESSPEPPELHYLDEYDSHLTRTGTEQQNINIDNKRDVSKETQSKLEKMDDSKLEENFKGQYLDHVPHTNSPPSLLPLFPSFSVVCIGHSSLYNHSTGIRGHDRTARFRSGSEYLLPWSVRLSVNTERWVREMQLIGANPTDQCLRNLQNGIAHGRTESNEKVKLFVGFDYECPRGHRFTCGEPAKPLKHRKDYGPLNQDAGPLLDADLPLWLTCPCRKPRIMAQLMRIHVVTPKAPVSVTLQPRMQMPDDDGYFFPGAMEGIELGWAKYYVCRLPYIYVGPNGRKSSYRPNSPLFKGRFLRQCISVRYLPISSS
uniref:Nonsense-mediated mRNA decay factor SMG8 n=1 Tax=Meloidogyne incognita TaxID=6306 RepID=A0A914N987_MELIC